MKKISLVSGAVLFGMPYDSFYKGLIKHKENFPRLYKDEKLKPYLILEECVPLAEKVAAFKQEYISLKEASILIFGNIYSLRDFKRKRSTYCFLPIYNFNRHLYFKRADFDDFYEKKCLKHRVVRLKHIICASGFVHQEAKFYDFLKLSGFYNEVRAVRFNTVGRKFYILPDVNAWLKKNHLSPIVFAKKVTKR